jgi:hypothetical protein
MTERSIPASRNQRLRLAYALAALGIIVAGLLWRRPELGLPPLAAKYGGSVLWGAMVFFVVATLRPSARLAAIAGLAAVIAAGVEFSQALHIEWLDAIRRHALGRLLLGRTFSWWDIAAYWVGIIIAYAATAGVRLTQAKTDLE